MASSARDIQLRELRDTILQLNKTIEELRGVISAGQAREAQMQEQIEYLTKKLFGTSSEKCRPRDENQISLFDEAEQESDPDAKEPPLEQELVREHTRKAKTRLCEKLKGIPVEQRVYDITDEEKVCPQCGTALMPIGSEVVRRALEYIPAKVKVIEYVSLHYGCPACKQTDEPYIVKAKVPAALMKHSLASASSVAWVMYQKYANALPLKRQEKDWKQYGITLSRATMANWIIYCSSHYFTPLYDYFHRKLLERQFLMADETRVQVLKEPGRSAESDSFMWLYRTGEDGLPPIILYKYTPTRAGANAALFLDGFNGYLACDAYAGYNKVSGIKRCCCWSHIRRYFMDAIPKGKEYDYSHAAAQGFQFCEKLFYFEHQFKDKCFTYKEKYNHRLQKEKPVIDAFKTWLEAQNPVRNTRLDKAVNYARNQIANLDTYLEDGRCSLSNNLSENSIRPFTVGRKNWLFSDSQGGAEASATVYSIVEMAKAHNLNIFKYLSYVLEQRIDADSADEGLLDSLAPWNKDVISLCANDTERQ